MSSRCLSPPPSDTGGSELPQLWLSDLRLIGILMWTLPWTPGLEIWWVFSCFSPNLSASVLWPRCTCTPSGSPADWRCRTMQITAGNLMLGKKIAKLNWVSVGTCVSFFNLFIIFSICITNLKQPHGRSFWSGIRYVYIDKESESGHEHNISCRSITRII